MKSNVGHFKYRGWLTMRYREGDEDEGHGYLKTKHLKRGRDFYAAT